MGLISKKRAEWLNLKYLVFSFFLFLSIVRPLIESAPVQPNKYYHTVGVETFRFQFPSAKSRFNYAEKVESLGSDGNGGIKLALHHNIHPTMINSTNSTKWMKNVVLDSLNRDKYRANAIIAANSTYNPRLRASVNVPLVSGNLYGVNFIVSIGIGTPPKQEIKMNFDTANDVSWLLCNDKGGSSSYESLTCASCNSQVDGVSCNRQLNQCIYEIQYDDGGLVKANMSKDTLWFGSRPFHKFTFGCGYYFSGLNSNPSVGVLALGRNSLSLPSQTASRFQRKFSYCLPNFLNPHQAGSLRLGRGSIPLTSKFTALLSNPSATSWYFVGMDGISVAGKRVKISPDVFRFRPGGGGGTMIDSGILLSRIAKPAYDALRAAFVKKIGLSLTEPPPRTTTVDTCFNYSQDIRKLKIPGITFHFQDGVRFRIHKQGILMPVAPGVICLAFQAADESDLSVIGALQQQGYIISFDQDAQRIGFASVRTCAA